MDGRRSGRQGLLGTIGRVPEAGQPSDLLRLVPIDPPVHARSQVVCLGPPIAVSETLIGIALILGLFTGIAAFFGSFLNVNFMLAGNAATNPILFILAIVLMLGWKTAGWIGLDHWVLPIVGTPWRDSTGEWKGATSRQRSHPARRQTSEVTAGTRCNPCFQRASRGYVKRRRRSTETRMANSIETSRMNRRTLMKQAGALGLGLPAAAMLINACGTDDDADGVRTPNTSGLVITPPAATPAMDHGTSSNAQAATQPLLT